MRLIAHRGNLNGPNPLVENDPQRITYCIDEGYDVEIDVRYDHPVSYTHLTLPTRNCV